MSFFKAYSGFSMRFRELDALLKLSKSATPTEQVSIAQGAVVLTSGCLEGYLNGVADEVMGHCKGTWNPLPAGMRRYISLCAHNELREHFEKYRDDSYTDTGVQDQLWKRVAAVSAWYSNPSTFATSKYDAHVLGFYRDGPLNAIERYLKSLHPTGASFTAWLSARAYDLSRISTVLLQLMAARTAFAHGSFSTSITSHDARLYLTTTTIIVRAVGSFLKPQYP